MNKRGQFFLIAALVLAGIIITLTTINISTKTPETKTSVLYDLSKESSQEVNKLSDYATVNVETVDEENVNQLVNSLIANYVKDSPGTSFAFIYGDTASLNLYIYDSASSGKTCILVEGPCNPSIQTIPSNRTVREDEINGNNVTVALSETRSWSTILKPGKNFLIRLEKEVGGETIVAQ